MSGSTAAAASRRKETRDNDASSVVPQSRGQRSPSEVELVDAAAPDKVQPLSQTVFIPEKRGGEPSSDGTK